MISIQKILFYSVGLVGWFLNVLVNYKVISRTGPKTERLTILRPATHETEPMTSVSAGHIILTPTQPGGSGQPQRESNPGPHQETRALPTDLPRPLLFYNCRKFFSNLNKGGKVGGKKGGGGMGGQSWVRSPLRLLLPYRGRKPKKKKQSQRREESWFTSNKNRVLTAQIQLYQ